MEKRKQTLDDMFKVGKITQATYEYLIKDINGSITELKARQKALTEGMTPKADDLEKQLKVPETYTTNLENYYSGRKADKESCKNKDAALAFTPLREALPPPVPTAVVKLAHADKLTEISTEEIIAIPEIVVSAPTKEGRKHARKTKKRAPKKVLSKAALRGHCRNPWNGKCRNTNTEVIIYYKNQMLPICRDCWHEIVDKNITW